jgi:hypothetical protein
VNDTSEHFAELAAERHREMSPEQRLEIASSMFGAARAIVEASLPRDLTRWERRLALIKRFYADELPEAALLAFAAWPERRGAEPEQGVTESPAS